MSLATKNKHVFRSVRDMILMYVFFGAFPIMFNKDYREETAMVVALVLFIAIINFFLARKYDDVFVYKAIALSIFPLTFGILEMAISVWILAFGVDWGWISIVLGTFWGTWIFPILLPKLSTKIEAEIMHPKTVVGKWAIAILIGMGSFGAAASGRLASRALKNGDNWGAIFLGLGMASLAFILQYAFVHQAWQGHLEAMKKKEGCTQML